MASSSQAYRTLLDFIGSLSYTDFSTLRYSLFEELLQEAGVDFEQDAYMLDIPPYTTPVIELCFDLIQQTGHRNTIRLTFTEQGEQGELSEFHLRTTH
jgi:hypothetical protein